VVAVQPQPNHKVQGLRNMAESMMPKVLEKRASLIDEWVTVTNDEAFEGVRELASEFSMFAGPSSGAVYSGARKLQTEPGQRVVMMFGDSGLKYRTVYLENGVFSVSEMGSLMEKKPYNELLENSYSPASRAFRGEL
jgi:cysteine synthase B